MTSPSLKKHRRGVLTVAWAIAGLASVTLALWLVYPRMTAIEHLASGRSGPIALPWSFSEASKGNRLDLTVPVRWLTPHRWTIIPDDHLVSIRANGQTVPLAGIPPAALNDWQNGFSIDLGPWLRTGENEIEITVDNGGGPGGATVRPVPGWQNLLLVASLVPWLVALGRVFRVRRTQLLVLTGALAVLCWYWSATAWSERTYDVKRFGEGGHIDYVVYVAEHGSLPALDQGWEFYQPPLYYAGAALAWRWAGWLGLSGTETVQAYSLMLWTVFLAASVGAINLSLRGAAWTQGLAAAGLALWPCCVLHAVRIGNDVALYATAAVCTWFLVRWWRAGRRVHLGGMAVFVALAFLCKASAVALFGAAAALMALRATRHGRWRKPRTWAEASAALGIMLAGVALAVGRNVWYWRRGAIPSVFVSNIAGLDADLRVQDDPRNLVPLDIATFVGNPWMSSRDDATGRRNFWNYLLRSSLTGEFQFDGAVHRTIAILWGVLVLGLMAALLVRLCRSRLNVASLWRNAPWTVLAACWVGSVFCARALYPFPCQADFRYVVPVLAPFVLACVRGGAPSRGLLAAMAASAAVFFVTV